MIPDLYMISDSNFSFPPFLWPFQLSRSRRGLNTPMPGGKKPYDEKQAEAQLQRTLDKLTEGEGPHYKYANFSFTYVYVDFTFNKHFFLSQNCQSLLGITSGCLRHTDPHRCGPNR